ncbi:MAG: SCP2 sterol-binding domain-containing protein [Actinomycetota bacterium]|nr:SCP2 sterol-binding domain-containing protein [Actinomycetota bacterium]MDD5665717.1 SCP2 sterol-binding domain-containing protein [Actinomycetota bacterium]
MADVKLAPGAEEVAMAVMISDMLKANIEKPEKLKDFNKLKARVYIQAKDAETEMTMVFDRGSLTVYGGKEGNPDISIITDAATLLDLANINIKYGMPWYFDETGMAVVKKLLKGELKLQGMLTHYFALNRLTKIMSLN